MSSFTAMTVIEYSSQLTLTVRSAVAPMLGEPRISGPLCSQLVAGDVVKVLEHRGDWVHVRGADAYDGWMHTGYLSLSSGNEDTWRLSLGTVVREPNGRERALPLCARITPTAEIISGEAIDAGEIASRFPLAALAIAQTASSRYAGASYMWGGVTPWGCDCSGFVQRVFQLHGIALPRDAWQQALHGEAVSEHTTEVHAPADLLFFSDRDDRRVTHVGVSLGDGRMVHSGLARGGVVIEHLGTDDAYVARLRAQCVAVRRVIS